MSVVSEGHFGREAKAIGRVQAEGEVLLRAYFAVETAYEAALASLDSWRACLSHLFRKTGLLGIGQGDSCTLQQQH